MTYSRPDLFYHCIDAHKDQRGLTLQQHLKAKKNDLFVGLLVVCEFYIDGILFYKNFNDEPRGNFMMDQQILKDIYRKIAEIQMKDQKDSVDIQQSFDEISDHINKQQRENSLQAEKIKTLEQRLKSLESEATVPNTSSQIDLLAERIKGLDRRTQELEEALKEAQE